MIKTKCDMCKKPVSLARIVVHTRTDKKHGLFVRLKSCNAIDCMNKAGEKAKREIDMQLPRKESL